MYKDRLKELDLLSLHRTEGQWGILLLSRVTTWEGHRESRTRLLRCQSDATRSNKGSSHWIQQNHRGLMWENIYGGHLVRFPCSIRVTQSWLPRTILRHLLNISKYGNTAISAGNLFQCSSHCSRNIRKTLVHHKVGRALVERWQNFMLEVLKSPHDSQQTALTGPALNRELGQMTSRGLSQHRFFQDSVALYL